MTAAVLLLGYAAIAAVLGRAVLSRARWPQLSPGWGVLAWQSLTASVAGAVVLAGVALALPLRPGPVAELVRSNPAVVVEHYRTPIGSWPGLLTLSLVAALIVTVLVLTARTLIVARRDRARLRAGLDLVGRAHPDGYVLVEHASPLVFCLPGRQRRVVVSSGALALLKPYELHLVLGHERRHLRARHDVALAFSSALARTFPLRVFADGHREAAMLTEMAADDVAGSLADRRALGRALLTLGHAAAHPAGGSSPSDGGEVVGAAARIRRLSGGARPLGRARGALVALSAALVVSLPLGLSVAPAIEAAATGCCREQ